MSTNAYFSEQRIYFGGDPSVYYGFTLSMSGAFDSLEVFKHRETRDNIVSKVRDVYPDVQNPMVVATLLFFLVQGHDDTICDDEFEESLMPYNTADIDWEMWESLMEEAP